MNILALGGTTTTCLSPILSTILCIMLKVRLVNVKQTFFSCLGVSVATCMAILQVGSGLQLRSASTGTKEEDYENDAATIVQKCVSIMSTTFSVYAPM